ncbi:19068_t:CDS:2, partial [Cetraspora pellucida]
LITEKKQKKENMPKITIETSKGQKSKTAELEEENLSSVTFLSNKDQISDEQTKQTTCKKPISNYKLKNKNTMNNSMEKLKTMNTEDDNIVMQNKITSDTEMSTSNNEQEKSTENKPNMEHENIPVDSLASLYNNIWANNTDPTDKENEQDFTVVSKKKHRNKSRIATPKVGRTTVLKISASYTKARELQ